MNREDLYAALDLGSNSFHLLLARRSGQHFETVERAKEKVQLLAGFADGRLHPEAIARGEACLARFAQRLAGVPRAKVQMAGTHALREAADRSAFTAAAQSIIGVPLEVVTGHEEARLIYLGVNHHVPSAAGQPRLVVDIGGGSTELAWGDGPGEPQHVASYKVGCVALKDWCFGPGVGQPEGYRRARDAALAGLDGVEPRGATEVIGTSGTVESVQGVLAANGWGQSRIGRDGLAALSDAIVSGRWLVDAGLPGLAPERLDIFPAGLAVLDALFEVLGMESMRFVDASLQDGLLCRLCDAPEGDLRAATVARLQRRFDIDLAQAGRVRTAALALFDAAPGWFRHPERGRALLGWAAELHEIGKAVSYRQYHRHGAYLLQHSDLRSFSATQIDHLVLLLRGHRRAFPGMALRAVDDAMRGDVLRLLALLRLAVIVCRSHTDEAVPELAAAARGDCLTVDLPDGWLAAQPLSAKELEVETGQLRGAGLHLTVAEVSVGAAPVSGGRGTGQPPSRNT